MTPVLAWVALYLVTDKCLESVQASKRKSCGLRHKCYRPSTAKFSWSLLSRGPLAANLFLSLCFPLPVFQVSPLPFQPAAVEPTGGPGELRGSRAQALADPSHLYGQPSRSRCLQHTSWWPEEAQGLLVRTSELSSPPIALPPLAFCESPPLPPHSYGVLSTRSQSKQAGAEQSLSLCVDADIPSPLPAISKPQTRFPR